MLKKSNRAIKAYHNLVNRNVSSKPRIIKYKLCSHTLFRTCNFSESYELCLRQFLTEKILHRDFLLRLVLSINGEGGIKFDIPNIWLKELSKQGVKLTRINLLFNLGWHVLQIKLIFSSIAKLILMIYRIFRSTTKLDGEYTYVHGLDYQQVRKAQENNHDFVSFIDQIIKHSDSTANNNHNFIIDAKHPQSLINDKYLLLASSIPFVNLSLVNKMSVLLALFFTTYRLFLLLLKCRNLYMMIITHEIFLEEFASLLSNSSLPSKVYYPFTGRYLKPLWLDNASISNNLVFYSGNIKFVRKVDTDPSCLPLHLLNWNNYIVISECEKDKLSQMGLVGNFDIYGPFEYQPRFLKNLSSYRCKKILSVFEILPLSTYRQAWHAADFPYYDISIYKKFFTDLIDLSNKYGYLIITKSKNNSIDSNRHEDSFSFLNQLLTNHSLVQIDADLSAECLIKVSNAVVCMPMTNVAHLAIKYDKPTRYYSATGSRTDLIFDGSCGVEVINDKQKLEKWFISLEKFK